MPPILSSRNRSTPRFVLRPFRRKDADALVEAIMPSLPELEIWLPWAAAGYTRASAARFIKESGQAWREGRAYDMAIRRRDEPDRHIGNVSLWYTSRLGPVGEIGYWIRTDETRQGICTEVVARVLQIAYEELAMHRVVLRIAVGNAASERVAEKLGFLREGLLREEVKVGARWLDHTIWGLLDSEYRHNQAEYRSAGWTA